MGIDSIGGAGLLANDSEPFSEPQHPFNDIPIIPHWADKQSRYDNLDEHLESLRQYGRGQVYDMDDERYESITSAYIDRYRESGIKKPYDSQKNKVYKWDVRALSNLENASKNEITKAQIPGLLKRWSEIFNIEPPAIALVTSKAIKRVSGNRNAVGQHWNGNSIITINKNLGNRALRQTLLHELAHELAEKRFLQRNGPGANIYSAEDHGPDYVQALKDTYVQLGYATQEYMDTSARKYKVR